MYVQPGVANVYCAVTQHSRNGATFYLQSFPSMVGRPYRCVQDVEFFVVEPCSLLMRDT